jgi:hypothetical protein
VSLLHVANTGNLSAGENSGVIACVGVLMLTLPLQNLHSLRKEFAQLEILRNALEAVASRSSELPPEVRVGSVLTPSSD